MSRARAARESSPMAQAGGFASATTEYSTRSMTTRPSSRSTPCVNRDRELTHYRRLILPHPGSVKSGRLTPQNPRLNPLALISGGSSLDTDHLSRWVIIARRSTLVAGFGRNMHPVSYRARIALDFDSITPDPGNSRLISAGCPERRNRTSVGWRPWLPQAPSPPGPRCRASPDPRDRSHHR